jgi:fucose permease
VFLLAGLVALTEFAATAYVPAITIIADSLGVQTEIVQSTVLVGLLTGAIAGLIIGAVADSTGFSRLSDSTLRVASALPQRPRFPGYLLVVYFRPLAPARE